MRLTFAQIIAVTGLALFSAPAACDEVSSKFVPNGVTRRVGGYRPMRAEMDQKPDIVQVPPAVELKAPKYGLLKIDEQQWAFILDEPESEPARLFIDANGDGDLTNDPEVKWEINQNGTQKMYNGSGSVNLDAERIGSLGLYRFDPLDESRPQLKNTLLYYVDYGTEFSFQLDGRDFSTFVAGSIQPQSTLPIDRDGNGRTSRNFETVQIDQPFNYTGTTYVFSLQSGQLHLAVASEPLEKLPLPPDLQVGKPALTFTAKTMNGAEIEFPRSYAGKIIMLDFWATWCGPCIAEIPNMKKAYAEFHDQGFEILGISFDQEGMEEKIEEFLKENELPWEQIYEGKYWDTELGKMHDVSGIPFVLLVDGDSGLILGTSRELRGEGLAAFIGQQLEIKNGAPPVKK